MRVKTRSIAPIAHEAPMLEEGAIPIKPTIMRLTKMPTKPYRKIVRRPKWLIIGHDATVPTNAIAYCR